MSGEAIRGVFRHLVQAGVSTAAICRELGISRQTAYNWKASVGGGPTSGQEPGIYGPRSRSGSLLDPYRDLIEYRLREFPSLSAVRLFAEIREAGYCGGYDLVKRYAREVRPRPPKEPVVRFETAPGRQVSMGFENVPLLGFENVPLFRGDWVPAEGWVDGIWRGCGRIGGGG